MRALEPPEKARVSLGDTRGCVLLRCGTYGEKKKGKEKVSCDMWEKDLFF